MKHFCFLLVMSLLMSFNLTLKAQGWDYNANRIAVSSDGNSAPDYEHQWATGDPDDWGANAAILAILAKEDLHDKLVHFSYNNFIEAPAGPDSDNQNKISCEGQIERLGGFRPCVFFDVTTDLHEARTHLALEMAKSTADDPLYFVHAGLSEFVYQVVKEVIAMGKIEALSHVKLISHSGFNETHLRRTWHHTWPQIQELCGNRIQYKKIVDQNAKANPNELWSSDKDYSVWYWMRDHEDKAIQFIYERAFYSKKADISDCGMVYYLVTADEYGSPEKFKAYLGDGIAYKDTLACESVIVPTDSAEIINEDFKLQKFETKELDIKVWPVGATNKGVQWSTSNKNVVTVNPFGRVEAKAAGSATVTATTVDGAFTSSVTITIEAPQECEDITYNGVQDFDELAVDGFAEAYKDNGRNAVAVDPTKYPETFAASQRMFEGMSSNYDITITTLTEEDGESFYRLVVDDQVIGEFQNPEATQDMGEYTYTFPAVPVPEGAMIRIESKAHSNGKIPEGNGFAWARGRWRSIKFECTTDCMVEETDGLLIFEAERFEMKGDWEIVEDDAASGGKYITYAGGNLYSEHSSKNDISYTFRINTPGNYTVKCYLRQPEGERGTDKGNDVWINFDEGILWGGDHEVTHFTKFYGRSEDDFIINGIGEIHNVGHKWLTAKFPEAGEYTIYLSGRSHGFQIDRFILFKGMDQDQADNLAQGISETSNCGVEATEKVGILNFPKTIPNKQTEIEIKYNYTAFEQRDIRCSLLNANGDVVAMKDTTVQEGIGTDVFTFQLEEQMAVETGCKIQLLLLPVDGDASESVATKEKSFDVIDGDAPAEKDDVEYVEVPTELTQDQLTVPIKVTYSATEPRTLNIEAKKEVYIIHSMVNVPAGYGDTTIVVTFPEQLDVYDKYKFILAIRPIGGDWKTNIVKREAVFAVTKATSQADFAQNLEVYPNPFEDAFKFVNDGNIQSYKVFDLKGQTIASNEAIIGENNVSMSDYNAGTYFLRFKYADASSSVQKLIKK